MQIHVRRKLGVRLRRSALRKGCACPGLGHSSDFLVYGEAAPRLVRRSLTPNDKGDLGATEGQSLSAKLGGEPQATGRQVGHHLDKLSGPYSGLVLLTLILDKAKPHVLACAGVRACLARKDPSATIQ